jgi:hypothetical protein
VGDDIIPERGFIQGHLSAHQRMPQRQVAILGNVRWASDLPQNTLMKYIDGPGAQQFSYYWLKNGSTYDYRHFYTSNISLKTDFLRSSAQLFDLDFKYAAFEDAELAFRLTRLGLRIIYFANIRVNHYHYHTIWSFSKRQFICGLMACVFVQKHPSAAPAILKANLPKAALNALFRGRKIADQNLEVTSLEKQLLHLCCYYEWAPHELLDGLYMRALDYYYIKGILTGLFSNPSIRDRILRGHARSFLKSSLDWFYSEALNKHIDLPTGIPFHAQSLPDDR